MNAVTCVTWVKRGIAKQQPDKVKLTANELKQLIKSQEEKLKKLGIEDISDDDDAAETNPQPSEAGTKRTHGASETKNKSESKTPNDDKDFDDIVNKYGLEDYDQVDDGGDEDKEHPLAMEGIAFYGSIADDPYIKDKNDSEDELDIEEDDNVIAVGRIKGNYCILEAHVYNEDANKLFCHHDILLPSFPLALEWIDYDPSDPDTRSNLVAMGTMEPDIEIWDLDVVDSLEPAFVLQGAAKKSKKKKKKTNVLGHSDAVLDLSWNQNQRKVLASASADFTIGLWDLEEGKMVTSITKHDEKVQALQWHPEEAQSLLSGSFDHSVKVYDCRSPNDSFKSWSVEGEVERVLWNHHSPYNFLASTDKGEVYLYDVRKDEAVFKHKVHNAAVTGLCLSNSISNCLVTTSSDKMVKVWDIQSDALIPVMQRNMKMGELHSAAMSPDSPLIVAVGGETDFRIINLGNIPNIAKHFGFVTEGTTPIKDEIAPDAGLETDEEENAETGAKAAAGKTKNKKKKNKNKKSDVKKKGK